MNGHRSGVVDLAQRIKPALSQDPRLQRTKVVPLDLQFIAALLQLDGTQLVTMKGWPKGALIIGSALAHVTTPDGRVVPQLHMLLYHPDFPIALAGPPVLRITLAATPVQPPAEEGDDAADEGV